MNKNKCVIKTIQNIESKKLDCDECKSAVRMLKKYKWLRWKQLYRVVSYQPLKDAIVDEIFNGIEPSYEQHFIKSYWKYPSSLSFKDKYSEDVQNRVIEAFREMTPEEIENGIHPNISLCSNLNPGGKKLFKWKNDGVRIIYGTIKRSHFLNIVFFDSSGMKTTGKTASEKDKRDIRNFQKKLEAMEAKMNNNNSPFADSADVQLEKIKISKLFESVGFEEIFDFDENFVKFLSENCR